MPLTSQPALKPPALRAGDVCVVVSPSWGGAAQFPRVYEAGLAFLRDVLGLVVREAEHARAPAASVAQRVADLHAAFADREARLIVTSIGGDDSLLLLPHLDLAALARNPKIVLGFSDTTTLLTHMARSGLVSFNGPSVMAGLAQAQAFGVAHVAALRAMLFEASAPALYTPHGFYHEGYEDWAAAVDPGKPRPRITDAGPHVVQGSGRTSGVLFGGCLEILEFLEGTPYWPMGDAWNDVVLFCETSEEVPTPQAVKRALRSWGIAGIFDRISALLVGRPRDYTAAQKLELDAVLKAVIGSEFGRPDLPVLANLDFGHTDPQWIMPLGARIEVDATCASLRLLEAAVTPHGLRP
jgi:muramoyltetrapeptide carboxypeptidase LdcA involved in peptidoglycan recycling